MRFLTRIVCWAIFVACWSLPLVAADPPAEKPGSKGEREKAKPPTGERSDAEKIIQLEQALKASRKELQTLQKEMEEPPPEYREAEAEFKKLDEKRTQQLKEIEQLRSAGKTAEAKNVEESLKALQKEWETSKERFELAVKERQLLKDKAKALETKIAEDQKAYDRLTGKKSEPDNPGEPPPEKKTPSETKEPPKEAKPAIPGLPVPGIPGVSSTTKEESEDPELAEAAEEARRKAKVAQKALEEARSLKVQLDNLREGIKSEQRLLEVAQEKAELARKNLAELDKLLQQKKAEGVAPAELDALAQKKNAEEQALARAEADRRAAQARLTDFRAELSLLQTDQLAAMREAEQKQKEAKEAEELVMLLAQPFMPRNIVRWLGEHGLRILVILVVMLVLRWAVGLITHRRITRAIARRERLRRHGSGEARAETLASVVRYALSMGILTVGVLMILDEVGFSITTLVGGAAVVGLAVSFGAQNLIKDYFTGFMILTEDQYSVGDVVEIGNHIGLVEKITLRVTVLRDLGGRVHFLPNGTIAEVVNLTHTWSRALFEIQVAYKEDPNYVIEVLRQLCTELRQDEKYRPSILEDVEMLGVDAFTDSAVVIKFFLKTRPGKQWEVQREMLRRIKCRFDELGIEIPFPQRAVHHHYPTEPGHASGNGSVAVAEGKPERG
jgi:small-conductance mechanosensitive channel